MAKEIDLTVDGVPSDAPIDTKDDQVDINEAILKQARDRMSSAWMWWEHIYEAGKEDVRFAYDDQWPDYAKKGRENRPMLTMNQLPEHIHQVTGDARRAKFAIHIQQLSGKNVEIIGQEGSNPNYTNSQIMEGLIRDIEFRSKAHKKYCRALQHSVEAGIGWLCIKTVEPPDDPFSIELQISHIKDRWSPLIDQNAEEEDYSDAMWCSIAVDIDKDEFKERWPDIPVAEGAGRHRENEGSYWRGQENSVRVSDYWWKEPMERTAIELFSPGEGAERLVLYEDDVKEVLDELKAEGWVEKQRKEVDSYKVMYMRHSYDHILEEPTEWPSLYLPLIPVLGRHINSEDEDSYIGLIRHAHDPQRMYNFWASSATERVALSPKNPYIADADSLAGYKDEWEQMYTKNQPVLLYKHEEGVPPPKREPPASVPAAELQLLAQARAALQDSIGQHDSTLGGKSNETSGVAIQSRQQRGSTATFEFIDNLAFALTHVGVVLTDMIPRIYTDDRARRIVMPDDTTTTVHLNHQVTDKETGKTFRINTLDLAKYSCRVSVGPASTTQRQEFVDLMMEWGRSDPEAFQSIRDLVVANMDFPMAREIAQRLKTMVPRELLSPEEQKALPPVEPTPADEAAQLAAEAEKTKQEAIITVANNDVTRSELRVKSEEARLQFELERGLNRGEERQEGENKEGGFDPEDPKVQAVLKRMVAQAVAERA